MLDAVAVEVPRVHSEPLALVFWETGQYNEIESSSEGLWISLGEREAWFICTSKTIVGKAKRMFDGMILKRPVEKAKRVILKNKNDPECRLRKATCQREISVYER